MWGGVAVTGGGGEGGSFACSSVGLNHFYICIQNHSDPSFFEYLHKEADQPDVYF